eukprot:gene42490-52699_t
MFPTKRPSGRFFHARTKGFGGSPHRCLSLKRATRQRRHYRTISPMNALPASQGSPIHIAIVEDDASFMGAFLQAIHGAPDMRLVGSAGNRAQGLAMLDKPPADVLLVDLGLPDGSGIDLIRACAAWHPHCDIMVITMFGDEKNVLASIEAGAVGYLLKDTDQLDVALPPRLGEHTRALLSAAGLSA